MLTRKRLHQKSRAHAGQRLADRYGLHIDRFDYDALCRRVSEDNVLARIRLTCSRSLVLIDYKGQELMLIFSNSREDIITFLPPDDPKRAMLEAVRRHP